MSQGKAAYAATLVRIPECPPAACEGRTQARQGGRGQGRCSLEGGPTKPRPRVPIQGHMGASRILSHSLLSRSKSVRSSGGQRFSRLTLKRRKGFYDRLRKRAHSTARQAVQHNVGTAWARWDNKEASLPPRHLLAGGAPPT